MSMAPGRKAICAMATLELRPSFGILAEPFPHLGARSDAFIQSSRDAFALLTPRGQSRSTRIDMPVLRLSRFVSAFQPALVYEVSFWEWTDHGHIRHASVRGLSISETS